MKITKTARAIIKNMNIEERERIKKGFKDKLTKFVKIQLTASGFDDITYVGVIGALNKQSTKKGFLAGVFKIKDGIPTKISKLSNAIYRTDNEALRKGIKLFKEQFKQNTPPLSDDDIKWIRENCSDRKNIFESIKSNDVKISFLNGIYPFMILKKKKEFT